MISHSPEPWQWWEFELRDGKDKPLPFYGRQGQEPIMLGKANARRAKICVNACVGMDDPATEIAALRAALLWYADPSHWRHPMVMGEDEQLHVEHSEIENDCGNVAMAALGITRQEDGR